MKSAPLPATGGSYIRKPDGSLMLAVQTEPDPVPEVPPAAPSTEPPATPKPTTKRGAKPDPQPESEEG